MHVMNYVIMEKIEGLSYLVFEHVAEKCKASGYNFTVWEFNAALATRSKHDTSLNRANICKSAAHNVATSHDSGLSFFIIAICS